LYNNRTISHFKHSVKLAILKNKTLGLGYRSPLQGVQTMKEIIIVIIMVFISIGYLEAVDKKTADPVSDKAVITFKGYLPLPTKYKYPFYKKGVIKENETSDIQDCIEKQRRIINYGRMTTGDQGTTYRGYHNTIWITNQCMEIKGYVGRRHKLIEHPYLD
jgi:hypothetical protein